MIKISELKRIKKLCFDKLAREAPDKSGLIVAIKPLGLELVEILLSNGTNYGRIIVDNPAKDLTSEVFLGWYDFVKICELFKKEVRIDKKDNTIKVTEGKTVLNCPIYRDRYTLNSKFKFAFDSAIKLETKNLFVLDDHAIVQKYAIYQDKLISSDGSICILNKLTRNFGDKAFLYTDKFPDGNWYINQEDSIVVSENKRIALTHRKAVDGYPMGLLQMSQQPLSNSFECDAKELYEKIQQCALIYEIMDIKFGKDELKISSTGGVKSKSNATYETTLPVKFESPTQRDGFQFAIKYFIDFCKCADAKGRVKILFDDCPTTHMFRTESDKYIIFGMGIASQYKSKRD